MKQFYVSEISCDILGYAKCEWHEDTTNNAASNTNINRGRMDYIKESLCLLGDSTGDGSQFELIAGEHKYSISYALGPELPTSFKCKNGSIKYKLRVTIGRPWKLNSKFEFPFIVIRPLNLNNERPMLKHPASQELSKNFKLDFTPEPLFLTASIPFTGYVPGQTINVSVQVNNQSRTNVKEVRISLKKIVSLNTLTAKKKTKVLIVSEAKVFTEPVPMLTLQSFEKTIVVPSLPPNILNCEVILVQYELRVKAKTSGLSRSPKLKIPVTIGTTPLDNLTTRPSCSNLRKFKSNL